MASIEEKVEEQYKSLLDSLGIRHYGKTEKINPNITNALRNADSKSGGSGNNYPDIQLIVNNAIGRYAPVMIMIMNLQMKTLKLSLSLSLSGFGHYEERDSEDAVKVCKEFKISDLFELQKVSNKLAKEDLSDEYEYPAYSSDTGNNGIIGYTDNPEFVCDDETPVYITFGDHTRTLNIARKSFSVLDNVKVLIPCYDNDEVLLYLTSEWQKQIPNLGYARHWKVAKDCILSLPIQTDTEGNPIIDTECKYHPDGYIPDWDFMEKYIRAIEKIVIADVVQYKDAMISKTKEVVA